MISGALTLLAALVAPQTIATTPAQPGGSIVAILVHGNEVAPDADVIAISGLKIGDAIGPTTLSDAKKRLEASNRFERVAVLPRFASISDPTQIVVILLVDEGPVSIELGDKPGDPVTLARRSAVHDLMYLPIFYWDDGYGATFGVTVAKTRVTSPEGRLSAPLSWGGTREAGLTFDRPMTQGPFTRVEVGTTITQQKNPAFQLDDTRDRIWARVERAMGVWRAGATVSWQHVTFGTTSDQVPSVGVDVTFDTRVDPILPRNAVLVTASIDHLTFGSGGSTNRAQVDSRGFIGLIGQTTLALRALVQTADRAEPSYLEWMLGGWSNLRGFSAGSFVGDTLLAGSLEIRIPLTSALDVGKIGVSVFADTGTVYAHGLALANATWHTGTGGSVWFAATILELDVAIARSNGGGFRVNVGGGLTF